MVRIPQDNFRTEEELIERCGEDGKSI